MSTSLFLLLSLPAAGDWSIWMSHPYLGFQILAWSSSCWRKCYHSARSQLMATTTIWGRWKKKKRSKCKDRGSMWIGMEIREETGNLFCLFMCHLTRYSLWDIREMQHGEGQQIQQWEKISRANISDLCSSSPIPEYTFFLRNRWLPGVTDWSLGLHDWDFGNHFSQCLPSTSSNHLQLVRECKFFSHNWLPDGCRSAVRANIVTMVVTLTSISDL